MLVFLQGPIGPDGDVGPPGPAGPAGAPGPPVSSTVACCMFLIPNCAILNEIIIDTIMKATSLHKDC